MCGYYCVTGTLHYLTLPLDGALTTSPRKHRDHGVKVQRSDDNYVVNNKSSGLYVVINNTTNETSSAASPVSERDVSLSGFKSVLLWRPVNICFRNADVNVMVKRRADETKSNCCVIIITCIVIFTALGGDRAWVLRSKAFFASRRIILISKFTTCLSYNVTQKNAQCRRRYTCPCNFFLVLQNASD